MKENLTFINMIIDMSGSMGHLTNDTIGSINHFIKEQQAIEGEAHLTLCLFNTEQQFIYDHTPLKEAAEITKEHYVASGGTALLDALGSCITNTAAKIESIKEEDRPAKVVFFIVTDGEENQSKKYTLDLIKEMVEHRETNSKWLFLFSGAKIDSFAISSSMGFTKGSAFNYSADSKGTRSTYKIYSDNLTAYRRRSLCDIDENFTSADFLKLSEKQTESETNATSGGDATADADAKS